VELVGKGGAVGNAKRFPRTSTPVRRRRIAHQSTAWVGVLLFFLGGSQIGFPKRCLASSWMSEDRRPRFPAGLLPETRTVVWEHIALNTRKG
jgi:hypothetical protein